MPDPATPTALPPGDTRKRAPRVHLAVCTSCGACVMVCPTGAVGIALIGQGAWVPSFDATRCIRCFDCEMACPDGAIEVPFEIVVEERALS